MRTTRDNVNWGGAFTCLPRPLAMALWNPPPPLSPGDHQGEGQEGEEALGEPNTNAIGDSVFSKAWVLSLLVKAVSLVEVEEEEEGGERDRTIGKDVAGKRDVSRSSGAGSGGRGAEKCVQGEEEVLELDEEIENDLCQLWDASVNEEVSVFLYENNAVPLFVGIIGRSKFPRLTEIIVGILGNMACSQKICQEALCTPSVMNVLILLLGNPDPKVLLEASRLMITCLSHDLAQPHWVSAVRESQSALCDVTFILKSSTNDELLRSIATLVDRLMDLDTDLLSAWVSPELVNSLCEAAQQTRMSAFDVTASIVMTIQLYCTFDLGVVLLLERESVIGPMMATFLRTVSQFEELSKTLAQALNAALTVCDFLLADSTAVTTATAIKDQQVVKFLQQIQESSCPGIEGGGGGGGGGEDKEEGEVGAGQLQGRSEGDTEQTSGASDVSARDKNTAAATSVGSKKKEEEEEIEEEEEEWVKDINAGVSTGSVRERDKEVQEPDAVLAKRILELLENQSYHPPPLPHLSSPPELL